MFIFKTDYERLLSQMEDLQEENENLYEQIEKMNEQIEKMRKKIALAGNVYYQQDAKEYAQKYHEVCRKCGDLQGQVNALTTENTYLRNTIKMYQESLKPEQILSRDTTGKFISDMTKEEKCELASKMREAGMKDEEIAAELGVKYDTVRKYAALHEKNRQDDDVLVSQDGGRSGRWVKRSEAKNGVWSQNENYQVINL